MFPAVRGGQHACLVADALAMRRVLIIPTPGVLSAYGMGLAEIRALREVQHDAPLDDIAGAKAALDAIATDAHTEVAGQGIDAITTLRRAHLRYDGSHQALDVPYGDARQMQADFEAAHKQRFGFYSPERAILFEMLSAEAIGQTGQAPSPALPSGMANRWRISRCMRMAPGKTSRSMIATRLTQPQPFRPRHHHRTHRHQRDRSPAGPHMWMRWAT